MSLRIFKPCRLLAPFVEAFWDYEDLTGEDAELSILPDTANYLCFLYEDLLQTTHKHYQYLTRSGLAGFQSYRSDLGGSGKISGVSARLTPWGMNVFLEGIAIDCAEKRVDCREIFPKFTIEKIEDELKAKPTAESRVQHIEQFLITLLKPQNQDLLIQKACQEIAKSNGNYSIAKLATNLDLSERTLERRFLVHVGTKPKKYARVVRLRSAIFLRKSMSNWADVANVVGFYDQSHMINDFKSLYGISPETLYPKIDASKTIQFSGLLNLS